MYLSNLADSSTLNVLLESIDVSADFQQYTSYTSYFPVTLSGIHYVEPNISLFNFFLTYVVLVFVLTLALFVFYYKPCFIWNVFIKITLR